MRALGFDNDKYVKMQSEKIRERIEFFGGKLYLEFGGKLFDDYHASRVLPGFQPDSKLQMLLKLKDQAEIVIAINANDIGANITWSAMPDTVKWILCVLMLMGRLEIMTVLVLFTRSFWKEN